MRVRTLNLMAGPKGCTDAGAVLDLPTEEALALIAVGAAVSIEPAAFRPSETAQAPAAPAAAVAPAPEATVGRRAKRERA